MAEISRISSGGYIPTNRDVAYVKMKEFIYQEVTKTQIMTAFKHYQHCLKLYDYRGDPGFESTSKWIDGWVDIQGAIYVINLAKLEIIEAMVASKKKFDYLKCFAAHRRLPVTVVLYNAHIFRQELDRFPLGAVCSDYKDGDDAIKCVVKWFSSTPFLNDLLEPWSNKGDAFSSTLQSKVTQKTVSDQDSQTQGNRIKMCQEDYHNSSALSWHYILRCKKMAQALGIG